MRSEGKTCSVENEARLLRRRQCPDAEHGSPRRARGTFQPAVSRTPPSAPCRSGLITGRYPTSIGTHHMRFDAAQTTAPVHRLSEKGRLHHRLADEDALTAKPTSTSPFPPKPSTSRPIGQKTSPNSLFSASTTSSPATRAGFALRLPRLSPNSPNGSSPRNAAIRPR